MKLKYTLAVAALALGTAAQAQTWIADTADMTSGYAKNVYYSLQNGTVKTEDANDWHIAIRANIMSVGIFANHAVNNVKVYPLTGLSAASKFGTNLVTDTVGVAVEANALYNSLETWEAGAFNRNADPSNQFDYGWGTYDISTHHITGDKLYLVTMPGAAYQVWIKEDAAALSNAHWTFKIANIDGTNAVTKDFDINPTYSGKLFAYYNFTTNAFVNRDPAADTWDFMFTKYTESVSMGPGAPVMYPVTGILSNENRGVYKLQDVAALNATWDSATMYNHFDSAINMIGRDWKTSTFANGVYTLDTASYFMQVPNGDVWQFEFTHASLGTTGNSVLPGRVGLRKRKVYVKPVPPVTGVSEVNAFVNKVLVVPNPAVGGTTNLLVDAKKELQNAQITIADLSGRVVLKVNKNINAGFQQLRLDVSKYPAGIYMINLSGAGFSTTQKLVVQ